MSQLQNPCERFLANVEVATVCQPAVCQPAAMFVIGCCSERLGKFVVTGRFGGWVLTPWMHLEVMDK